jgi:PAS domain-containing protein
MTIISADGSPSPAQEGSIPLQSRSGRRIQSLRRWLRAVATVLNTDAAMLVWSEDGISRVLTDYGIPHPFAVAPVPPDAIPYGWKETYIVPDASDRPDLHRLLSIVALEKTGFFFRIPIFFDGRRAIGLIAFGREPRDNVSGRDFALVQEIANAIKQEVVGALEVTASPLDRRASPLSREEFIHWVSHAPNPMGLLDQNLTILVANDALLSIRNRKREELIGHRLDNDDLPAESLSFYFSNALQSGVSTPDLEVALPGFGPTGEELRNFSVIGSPLMPIGSSEPLLLVTIEDITERARALDKFEDSLPSRNSAEATVDFLEETLVQRNALRTRNGTMYVTFRAWRQSIRTHQIRALKALKRSAPEALGARIAAELEEGVRALIGARAFYAIVPMPCGHSTPEACLSRAIARHLGEKLNLPVVDALHLPQMPGSSHPKNNVHRPPIALSQSVQGPILLVDDVATSGQHLEEACKLLRPGSGSVLAIAWIGGDAVGDEEEDVE